MCFYRLDYCGSRQNKSPFISSMHLFNDFTITHYTQAIIKWPYRYNYNGVYKPTEKNLGR